MQKFLSLLFCIIILSLVADLECRRDKVKLFSVKENDINDYWSQFKRNHIRSFRNSSDEKRR